MTTRITAVATISFLLSALPVYAQSTAGVGITNVSGKIVVDGAAYTGGALKVGDIIKSGPGSSAMLTFPDGCQVTVNPGTTVTIGATSPCAAAAAGNTAADPTVVTIGSITIIGAGAAAIIALSQSKQASP